MDNSKAQRGPVSVVSVSGCHYCPNATGGTCAPFCSCQCGSCNEARGGGLVPGERTPRGCRCGGADPSCLWAAHHDTPDTASDRLAQIHWLTTRWLDQDAEWPEGRPSAAHAVRQIAEIIAQPFFESTRGFEDSEDSEA